MFEMITEGYYRYLCEKIGERDAERAHPFHRYHFFENACRAALQLKRHYDYGISLATGGLWLGYIFEMFSAFPVVTARMHRRGKGATWHLLDDVLLLDKKVVLFDNDVVTGRTLRRAYRELTVLGCKRIDLLLVYGHTEASSENYKTWKHFLSPGHRVGYTSGGNLWLDTTCQIPEGFSCIRTLEFDFAPLYNWEEKLRGRFE